jgi:fluoroquinolone resistance protein
MKTKSNFQKIIRGADFSVNFIPDREYEAFSFANCNFNAADLSGIAFTDCQFDGCDLSNAKLSNTVLNDIKFLNCKLLGLHFDDCNNLLLTLYFENCQLNLSSFYKLNLKKTVFLNCNLMDSDLTETDLTGSVFDNCDFQGAIFSGTIIEKADLTSSFNYSIDPENNRIRKARFSAAGLGGLLNKYDIEIE